MEVDFDTEDPEIMEAKRIIKEGETALSPDQEDRVVEYLYTLAPEEPPLEEDDEELW